MTRRRPITPDSFTFKTKYTWNARKRIVAWANKEFKEWIGDPEFADEWQNPFKLCEILQYIAHSKNLPYKSACEFGCLWIEIGEDLDKWEIYIDYDEETI